jgi:RNA polymerase primary sigma factor
MDSKSDAIRNYMYNISDISLVTKEEEVELAAQIKVGCEKAREKLIVSNLRLVVKIAHDFKGLGLPLSDLISEGNIGLMRAVEKFDPAKGAKFSSYAAWWIKQSMRRGLANQSRTIRIPVQSAGKINKIRNARLELKEKLMREPTEAEIADYLDFSKRTVAGLSTVGGSTISLQAKLQDGEDGEIQDIVADKGSHTPSDIIGEAESISCMMKFMVLLTDREKLVLELRFGLLSGRPKTLEEVSQAIGRTRERVRQIQNQALKKLRDRMNEENLLN